VFGDADRSAPFERFGLDWIQHILRGCASYRSRTLVSPEAVRTLSPPPRKFDPPKQGARANVGIGHAACFCMKHRDETTDFYP
jgi:hypothetical protein